MKYSNHIFILLALALLFNSCKSDDKFYSNGSFHLHNPNETGVVFKNTLHDLKRHNALTYETFYSGGGVAIGDINNDGLNDIYLGGNQVGDALYLNKGDWKFEEATLQSGIINDGSWSTGVTMIDINQDGWLDLYVCKSLYDEKPKLRKNKLYINQKNGKFLDQAEKYGLDDIWRTQEACFFDFDNDGDLDVLIVNQPPNPGPLSPLKGADYRLPELGVRFLENDNGKFFDKTIEVGLEHAGYALSASIVDFNNDGWLDMYIAHDYNSPDKLYLNTTGNNFIDHTDKSCKQISFFSMGTDAADINNDGLDDFIVADMVASDPYRNKANMGGMDPKSFWKVVNDGGNYQYMYNSLQLNVGLEKSKPYFSNIAQIAGLSKTDWSWSPLIADFDNDGNKDVFISNGIKRDLRFTDGIAEIKGIINKVKSENNIGQERILDFVDPANLLNKLPSSKLTNFAFRNLDGISFNNKVQEWGIDQKSFSNGAAIGDLDNDGDLDLIVNNVDDFPFLYENKISNNNFLRIELKDAIDSNVSINGVKTFVYVNGKVLSNTSKTNHGFYSCSENTLHFGLGSNTEIDSVLVFWNDKKYSKLIDLKVNQINEIYKSQCSLLTRRINFNKNLKPLRNHAPDLNLIVEKDLTEFDDYSKQVLLPYQISKKEQSFVVADFNGDKRQDVLFANTIEFMPQLILQGMSGFENPSPVILKNKHSKATDIIAEDFDSDGDIDVYVSCGGNRFDNGDSKYNNYFLINDGYGNLKYSVDKLLNVSTQVLNTIDFDSDGDKDLLVASKYIPGNYPKPASLYLLENISTSKKVEFVDISNRFEFENLGLINDIVVTDIDGDKSDDILVVGEWMPITIFKYENASFFKAIIPNSVGWWMTAKAFDYDNDGLKDFLIGNLGDNAKYKSNSKNSFSTYFKDFDKNGKSDIVLAYEKDNIEFPVRGRSCSSEQIPSLKTKFPTYHKFASTDLSGIYGNQLNDSNKIKIDLFSSVLVKNLGDLKFEMTKLPKKLQLSTIHDIVNIENGKYLAVGNMNFMEVETPKIDASYGTLFSINSEGRVMIDIGDVSSKLAGQLESIQQIKINDDDYLIFQPIDGVITMIKVEDLNTQN